MADKNYFEILNGINVNDKVEKKNGLSYLSWAFAWGEIKKKFPDANYTVYENADGWNYFTDGKTCWVKAGVTVNGIEHIEYLPVMDYRNKSIPLEQVTSFDICKSLQRCITKAIGRHGCGLYIYAGEDLPEDPDEDIKEKDQKKPKSQSKAQPKEQTAPVQQAPVQNQEQPKEQTQPNQPVDPKRQKLLEAANNFVAFCKKHELNINDICVKQGLTKKSTAEDYKLALVYAETLVPGGEGNG